MKRSTLLPFAASLALGAVLFGACGSGDDTGKTPMPTTKPATDTAKPSPTTPKLEPYVLTNPITTPSGLKYQDEVVGTGATPQTGQKVTVNYVGKLVNGTKFDASADHGGTFQFTIGIGQVIKGWDEGVMGMKVGGKRLLYVPAALAYGSRSPGAPIPPNADLTFEVELLGVQQ